MPDDMMIRIGSDECLKGDTFGGLVVAAVKAGADERKKLSAIGARDSKKLSDAKVLVLSKKIIEIVGTENVSIVEILPEEYNEIKSVTMLLNAMHTKATETLASADEVVVDKYPGCYVEGAICETHAESKYVEVAAGSVLARAQGLAQIEKLSKQAGFKIPLGSTHVKAALLELKKHKLPPEKFVKTGFSNVKEVLGGTG